jgi:prohibitin 2
MNSNDFRRATEKVTGLIRTMGKSGGRNMGKGAGFGGAIFLGLGLTGLIIYSSAYSVEGGYRSIKFNRITGVGDKVFTEGIHFAIPILERPIIYDVRTRPKTISSLTGSKDLQMVNLTVRVLHRPDASKLQKIYRTLGMDYSERVLPSIGNEVLKSVVAKFTAAELLTKRRLVSEAIAQGLRSRASDFSIIIDDVAITHLGFGTEYTLAVEAKQVAQQEAERAKFIVEKALQEKKALIIKAEGEAQSARLLGEAMARDPAYLELRRIETAQEIAHIIAESKNRVFLSSDSLLLNMVDFQPLGKKKV